MADSLPQDALVEILIRTTVKTLLRCTSVCKSWHSIINSPSFAKTHLNRQKTTRNLLIIRTCTEQSQKEVYSWHYDDVAFNEVGCNSPYDHPYNNYYRILDSCDGVLCLVDDSPTYSEDTFLWNPAIRVWIKLPPQPVSRKSYLESHHSTIFGVDPVSNDYKVIRISFQPKGHKIAPKILKYTLSSNTWENVSHLATGLRHLIPTHSTTQAYFNGASHCIVMDNKRGVLAILLFHLGEEVFRSMELPANVRFTLVNWYGSLWPAVFQGVFSVVETRSHVMDCSLWTMEQYGDESSWVKRFEINLYGVFDRCIGFRKNGTFLLDILGKLFSHNPEFKDETGSEEQLTYLGVSSRIKYYVDSLHVLGYVESLALLGRGTNIWEE